MACRLCAPVSCLISSPDSFSCLQSPTPVSSLIFCLLLLSHVYCLQSSLFCFMSSVAYFILLSPISYFIRAGLTRPRLSRPRLSRLHLSRPRLLRLHHIFHVCIASFGTLSRLSHLLHIQMHSVDAMGEDTTVTHQFFE